MHAASASIALLAQMPQLPYLQFQCPTLLVTLEHPDSTVRAGVVVLKG